MKPYLNYFFAALIICGLNVSGQNVKPFQAGDRVAFLGNSITDGGHYHSYIWLYYMTHFPNMRITCFNVGVGGDDVKQMTDRFDTDVLTKKPTVITITWGMNDTGYFEWNQKDPAVFSKEKVTLAMDRYAFLDAKLKMIPNVKKIFILGSPYDETTTSNPNNLFHGKAAAFDQLISFQQATAIKNGWGYVDFFRPMTAINLREQKANPAFSLTPNDRIHPDNDGHLVMTYLFLKAQGLANKVVADISINASNRRTEKAINCAITNVASTNESVSFDYLANSLPYPLDTIPRGWGNKKKQSLALHLIPFMQEFDKELLTVNGLKDGNYLLTIDNQPIATYTAQQLSAGVNLAEQTNTPQYRQATIIRELNEDRWEMERKTREYAYVSYDLLRGKGLLFADNIAAMDAVEKEARKNPFINGDKGTYMKMQFKLYRETWQKEMNVIIDEIYTINKPVKHNIKLSIAK